MPSCSVNQNAAESSESDSEIATADLGATSFSLKDEISKYIEIFPVTVNNKSFRFVRCKVCLANPTVVQMFCAKKGTPSIATVEGTQNRTKYVQDHFESKYHQECKKAELLKTIQSSQNKSSMDFHISKANKHLADHIGKLLLQVYPNLI